MGHPVALKMVNRAYEKDADNWPKVMSVKPLSHAIPKITVPRPGHADLAGLQKFRFDDIRPVIERSSARETAMRVACCATARELLRLFGIQIGGHVLQIGERGYESWEASRQTSDPLLTKGAEFLAETADQSEVRCLDPQFTHEMVAEIKKIRKAGSSLGGIYEIVVTGLPAGLGTYAQWDRKLEGLLAQAIMSTQAMKGVEIGLGFESGKRHGHLVHDEIIWEADRFSRSSNRAGGLEGGITNGMPLIIRGVMKPIPTMLKPLYTVDTVTKQRQETRYERSDVCALPRAVVVAENVIAPILANAFLEKYGGDSIDEISERYLLAT